MFIVFEGVDGAGKTGFIQPFKEMLEAATNKRVVVTREPGGTPFGEAMRKVILSAEHKAAPMTELLGMMTIRMQHIEELIKPALANGDIVLCDRFHLSTIGMQCTWNGITEQFYHDLHTQLFGNFYPDLTIILNTRREIINQRKTLDNKDRFESRDSSFYDHLDAFYEEASKGQTLELYKTIANVNNNGSKDDTIAELKNIVLNISEHLR